MNNLLVFFLSMSISAVVLAREIVDSNEKKQILENIFKSYQEKLENHKAENWYNFCGIKINNDENSVQLSFANDKTEFLIGSSKDILLKDNKMKVVNFEDHTVVTLDFRDLRPKASDVGYVTKFILDNKTNALSEIVFYEHSWLELFYGYKKHYVFKPDAKFKFMWSSPRISSCIDQITYYKDCPVFDRPAENKKYCELFDE